MQKELFLEYKFGDYNLKTLRQAGATGLIAGMGGLTSERMDNLREVGLSIGVCISAFDQGDCPVNPTQQNKLRQNIQETLGWNPRQLWLDHFRFDGRWETQTDSFENPHQECQWCRGVDRAKFLHSTAEEIRKLVPKEIGLNYFAVPFSKGNRLEVARTLGQAHEIIALAFDCISPMLYHRMIGKPVSYISEYVKWLANATGKPILPIIQVKDMPDTLPDTLKGKEMQRAYQEAAKTPSIGVAWFSWDAAVEKQKTYIIKDVFKAR